MTKKYFGLVVLVSMVFVGSGVSAELLITSPNVVSRDGECPPGQVVVGQTNSIPPSKVCGPAPVTVESKGGEVKVNTERVLPTVNKVEVKGEMGAETNSSRLLPTVNKKTTAKIEVRGWDDTRKQEISGKIEAETEKNSQITSVSVDESNININYVAPGKLFWFIPITMNMNVQADANANVKVKFPWYKFMTSSRFSNSAQVMNGVFQNNQTDLEFLKSKATEQKQVEIFVKISTMLKLMGEREK